MSNGCPNCEALCTICQDNTYNWHEPLCSSCRLAVAHTEDRIIKLLEAFDTCYCAEDDPNPKHYRCGTNQGLIPQEIIALIKGEK